MKTRYFLAGLCLSIFFVLAALEWVARELKSSINTDYKLDGTNLVLNGEINDKTLDQFNQIYELYPEIDGIIQGKTTIAADAETIFAIGYRFRELGLNTHLRADSEIYSGGLDLFLSGLERTIEEGARLSIRAWEKDGIEAKDFHDDADEHKTYKKYYKDMLGDDAFYWFSINTASAFERVLALSDDQITTYKLITKPVIRMNDIDGEDEL